jgi:glucose/arabinose dehydrogenase
VLLLSLAAACDNSMPVPVQPGGNHAPVATITSPSQDTVVLEATPVTFAGSGSDAEDGPLPGSALAWSSSMDGALGTGASLTLSTLSLGSHTITLTATDDSSATDQATVTVTVTSTAPILLGLDTVAIGLSQPVFLTAPPGDANRLFIVEKTGAIRIVKNGALLGTAFLDIRDSVSSGSEQGLLGLAFDPNYATNGRFYVSYTSPHGDSAGGTSVLARYQVSADPDVADVASGFTLLTVDQPYSNHNGGGIGFGPDHYLYFGLGDGGSGGDPQGYGQKRTELLGSMLRLDVSGGGAYAIPSTNPFASSGTFRHELWNWGLRNPWRWSFDRQTGDLYIGDVGQGAHEEVDVQPATSAGGEDYGWNIMEGFSCYSPSSGCNQTGLTLPVLDYDHGQGCSITGGYVYRGAAIPAIQGVYFYSDYCTAFVRSFRWTGSGVTEKTNWPTLAVSQGQVTSFGQDASGELYVMSQSGIVYRIVAR